MVREEHFEGDCPGLVVVAGVLVGYEGRGGEDLGGGVFEVPPRVGAKAAEEVVDKLPRCEGRILVGVGVGSSGEGAPCKRRIGEAMMLAPRVEGMDCTS